MAATTLQIAIMVAVLMCLVWLAIRPSRPRGARRPSSGDNSWSGDATCNIADSGQHHGWGGHDSGSDHSSSSGDSTGGSDGGSGSDGGGGGSSD